MNKLFPILVFIMATPFIVISCSKNGTGNGTSVDCNTVSNKAFVADVNPIIQTNCAISGCHAAGATNSGGPLTNYNEIFNKRSNIRNEVSSGRMPQGGSLSSAQKNSILCWIDGGAPNN